MSSYYFNSEYTSWQAECELSTFKVNESDNSLRKQQVIFRAQRISKLSNGGIIKVDVLQTAQ